ncbi:MAG: DUF6516 family protein [Gammaproteobacteria bacterium]|nr:DUF6516 family protein [Gammaproteobacteria bacterium]
MDAELIHRDRFLFDDGAIVEMVIWRVPKPVPGSAHHYKYRLFYGYPDRRIVGYDNERLKGDHRHLGDVEEPCRLSSVEGLIHDFLTDIFKKRSL